MKCPDMTHMNGKGLNSSQYSKMSKISLALSPIYLPFMYADCSLPINLSITFCNLCANIVDIIL